MAKYVVKDPVVVFAGGTISANVAQATIALEADDIEVTNFGSAGGFRERIGGLKSGTFSMELHQDFALGSIDSTFFTNLGGTVAVAIRPAGGTAAVGSANPEYTFNVLVTEYSPIDSAVGDLATFSVSYPISGAVTRGTGA
jgi:glycine cleavage system aminomethyltransferase T